MDEDAEIIAEFLVESHENLDQMDRDLIELERSPQSRELLSSIFRTIHTIKGTSGFLAFGRLEELTHVGENLLSRLRDGELTLTTATAESLLATVDTVRAVLAHIEAHGHDRVEAELAQRVDAVVADLRAALEPAAVEVPAAELPAELEPEPVPEPGPALADAVPSAAAEVDEIEDPSRRAVVDSSVRVDVDLLDGLVQLVGELVLTRNQILQRTDDVADPDLLRAAARLDLVASELQESVMRTRMQPIGQVWAKMPRLVRDLAHQLGREVELRLQGHETELDRTLLEALKGPLTHLVRNALDHGIESPEIRTAAGTPAAGTLALRAFHENGQVVVEIVDDGAGMDPERIGAVAVQRSVVTPEQLARMDQRDVLALVFRPGFSTAAAVTNVSGRGVGMDVVRTNIERIGGTVDLTSVVGEGTTCRIRIPLTLAIIPALLIGQGIERYAVPQANLVELVRLEGEEVERNVERIAGSPVLRLRGQLLPLVDLGEVLGGETEERRVLTVVVVQADDVRFGLCVDDVHDTQEIVVKPIGRQLKDLTTYAGATIMGDGRVALILDVAGIARSAGVAAVPVEIPAQRMAADDLTSLLVLEVANGRRAALRLTDVSRLEEFEPGRVEWSGACEVVQYRDGILPLVRLAPAIGLVDTADSGALLSVVVHERDQRRVGIVIDRVLDVVDTVVVPSDVGRRRGVHGSTVVQDKVTDLVDLETVVAGALT